MIFTFGKFRIDTDVEKNHAFYLNAETVADGCDCDGCQNFEKAAADFPPKVLEFFDILGVSPEKAAEVFACCSENNGKALYYNGFYHLCGVVLEGESAWVPQSENVRAWDANFAFEVEPGFRVSFAEGGNALLEENFPMPVIAMEIEFHVPWVLDKPNTYFE